MRTLFLAIGLLSTLPAASAWGLTRQDFEKRLHKYAVESAFPDKPKSPCVCLDGGARDGSAGLVMHVGEATDAGGTRLLVTCVVEEFDASGNAVAASTCSPFEVLGK